MSGVDCEIEMTFTELTNAIAKGRIQERAQATAKFADWLVNVLGWPFEMQTPDDYPPLTPEEVADAWCRADYDGPNTAQECALIGLEMELGEEYMKKWRAASG